MPTVTVGQENSADIEIHYPTMASASRRAEPRVLAQRPRLR
jgi:hypothetical protein